MDILMQAGDGTQRVIEAEAVRALLEYLLDLDPRSTPIEVVNDDDR
jgi:hypothetical protein